MRPNNFTLSPLMGKSARRNFSHALTLVTTLTICILLTTTALGAPFTAPATQEAPQVAWNLQYVDDPPFMQNMRDHSLKFKSDGTPCVAYGGDHLYYACIDNTAHVWVKETVPDPDNVRVGEYASLGFNSTNNPFISYYDAERGYLKLAYKMSGVWNIIIVDPNPLLNTPATPDALAATEASTATLTPTAPTETPTTPAPETTESIADQLVDFIGQRPWRDPLLQVENLPGAPTIAPDNGGVGKYSSIAIDWANGVHISYYDQVRGSLKYAYWNGVSWLVEEIDRESDPSDVGVWSSIATDSRFPPRPHIAYMSEKYDDLKYAIKKSTGWEKDPVDGNTSPYDEVGVFASIAVDSNDRPHISYYDFTHKSLKYARLNLNTGLWQITTLDNNGNTGLWSSIAINSDDDISISYYNKSNGNLKLAKNSGGGWSTSTIYDDDDVGMFSSIAYDKFDRQGISFFNATTGTLEFTYHDGSNWNRSYIERIADVGLSTSLALDSLGAPYMSYFDDTVDRLKYAQSFGFTWYTTVVTDTQAGTFSSIKIGLDGNPRIAYYDMDDGDLEYAVLQASVWMTQTIDRTEDVGQYVSLAIDSSGYSHISYYNATDRNLNYAYWDVFSSSWVTQTINTKDNVGRYTSIALDSNNRPFISYFDTHNNDLKVIYKSPINTWVDDIVDDNVSIIPPEKPWAEAYTSIALDSGNNPHVSYFDDTFDQLKYARGVNVGGAVSWQEVGTIVDGLTTQSGRFNSIAINKAINQPSISYYDDTYHELRFAERSCAGPCNWAVQTVDTAGVVGLWTSLAYTYNNLPVISYYDSSNGALKIAFYPGYVFPPAKFYLPLIFR